MEKNAKNAIEAIIGKSGLVEEIRMGGIGRGGMVMKLEKAISLDDFYSMCAALQAIKREHEGN